MITHNNVTSLTNEELKICVAEYNKRYRNRNKEKVKLWNQRYYKKSDKRNKSNSEKSFPMDKSENKSNSEALNNGINIF